MARLISGCGMSMVVVSGLSLLLKATEFKTGTVLVRFIIFNVSV